MRTRKPCSKGRSSEILGWGRAWWRANIPKFLGHFFPPCSLFASAAFSIFLTCTNTGTNPVGVCKSHLVLSPLTLGSLPAPCSWPQHPTPARNFIRCYLLREGKRKNPLFLHRLHLIQSAARPLLPWSLCFSYVFLHTPVSAQWAGGVADHGFGCIQSWPRFL